MTTIKILFILLITASATSVLAQVRSAATPSPTPTRPAATPAATPNLTVAVPATKIAVIDTDMFTDEKAGIVRLVDAVKIVQSGFSVRQQEIVTLQNRINTLVEDINKLRQSPVVDQKTIQAKQEEGTRVQQDLQTKQQSFQEDYAKRYAEVTKPVSDLIGKELDQFANQHGITMTLDLSKLLPAILTAVPTVEVTQAFIAEFNRKYPRTAPATR